MGIFLKGHRRPSGEEVEVEYKFPVTAIEPFTLTPDLLAQSFTSPVQIVPPVAAGTGILDVSLCFVLGAGFSVWTIAGSLFINVEAPGSDPNTIWNIQTNPLKQALKEGHEGDIVGVWLSAVGALWSGPLSEFDGSGVYLDSSGSNPSGGDGDITVLGTITTIILP